MDSGIGSLELIPGVLKRLQIRAQATLASGIGSLESIPGLPKHLQIRVQATLDSGIVSLESIPGLLKRLQIRAQATLASGILVPWNRFLGFLNVYKYGLRLHWLAELVPWNRFLGSITIFLDRNEYIRPLTIKGTKNNEFLN